MKTLTKTYKGENEKGKNVLIIAGVHGNEITPIYTLASMIKNNLFNLSKINKLTILNGINITGIKNCERDMVENDTQDLNRIFTNETKINSVKLLKDKIKENDIVIDIHSSESCIEFALIDIDEYTNSIKSWCEKSKLLCAFRYSNTNTIKRYCLEKGKPSITFEINKLKLIDFDSAEETFYLINNLLDNVDFTLKKDIPNVKEFLEIKTYEEGILEHHFVNGDYFYKGDILYTLYDFELNEISNPIATFDGYVICDPQKSYVSRGEIIYLVQPN